MDFKVQSLMRSPRLVSISVAADGTLVTPNRNVTTEKIGTGSYLVTMKRSYQNLPFAFPLCRADGVTRKFALIQKDELTEKIIPVNTYTLGEVAADTAFDLLIMGSDGRGPQFNVIAQPVKIHAHRTRMLFFYYDGANAAQTKGFNPFEGTFTKTGTGRYTLVLRHPFSQDVQVIAVTNSVTRHVEVATANNKTITFETSNASSGAAADTELFIGVIGCMSKQRPPEGLQDLLCPHPFLFLNPFEYDAVANSMLRGSAYMAATEGSATDYTMVSTMHCRRAVYGFVVADDHDDIPIAAVNTRTSKGFDIDVEAACKVYGLLVGMRRGRDWA